jgi:hypothetical protein
MRFILFSGSTSSKQTKYALKILHSEVTLLGLRELVLLRYLSSKIPTHSSFCMPLDPSNHSHLFVVVRVQDAFVANEQLTLVFPCYEGTLINYISKIPFSSTNDLNQPFQPSSLDPSVLSPKFIYLPSLLPFPHRLLSSPPRTGLSDQFPIRLIVPPTAPHTLISLTTHSLQQLVDNLLKIFEILPRSFSLLFGS